MIAVARFRVLSQESIQFAKNLETALAALALCEGYLTGDYGQNTDDEQLWALTTIWKNVGSYRRALSNNQVKMAAIPVLALAIDEPGAYQR
jgi:quinol monooxygenase YgiN